MKNKISDRLYQNESGNNRYSPSTQKPPRRYHPKFKHRKKDPMELADEKKDKLMEKNSENIQEEEVVTNEVEKDLAKKVARKKLKIAGRPPKDDSGYNQIRDGLENYQFKDTGVRSIAKTYKYLADSFLNLTKSINTFSSCKSSEVSPDGKLGGKGYIQTIKNIRSSMAECLNIMSELIDTFHDEVNSPYWKKTTVDDHPVVKEILQQADQLLDQAEDLEGQTEKASDDPNKIILSEDEKTKVLKILKNKGFL